MEGDDEVVDMLGLGRTLAENDARSSEASTVYVLVTRRHHISELSHTERWCA